MGERERWEREGGGRERERERERMCERAKLKIGLNQIVKIDK